MISKFSSAVIFFPFLIVHAVLNLFRSCTTRQTGKLSRTIRKYEVIDRSKNDMLLILLRRHKMNAK